MTQKIFLRDLKFYAYHGVMEQENKVGGWFTVNLMAECDFTDAMSSDNIDDTENYATIYQEIKEEMLIPSKLLERLAARIIRRIFNSHTRIRVIDIAIKKDTPPVCNCETDGFGVEIEACRNDLFLFS